VKHLALAAALLTLAAPAFAEIALPEGLDLGPERTIGHVHAMTLQPEQAKAWRSFRKSAQYFGAMYVHDTADIGFVVSGFHDLATAHAAALKGCQEVARMKKSPEGACTVFATVVPEGTDLNARQGSGLGQAARAEFLGRYTHCQSCEAMGEYGAFAIAGGAEYGMSWGWPDAHEARETALAHCRAAVAATMAQLGSQGRAWAQARGLDKCRVIHTRQP
jgi:hypothetical protein